MIKTVVWSAEAKTDLISIKSFFNHRNKSSDYSTKLLREIKNAVRLIERYPDAAIDTNIVGTKGLIHHHYTVYFRENENYILILMVWDSRRDPASLVGLLKR